jgi:outer membrane protein OmpA-like peptidoglycan-associated protein
MHYMTFQRIIFIGFLLIVNSFLAQEIEVLKSNSNVVIEELTNLNTKYRECNLSLMPNGDVLYFMSTRSRLGSNGLGDGDIYRVLRNVDEWDRPEFVSEINTYNGEDEPSVSYDGEKIYFQSWKDNWEGTGGPYYEAIIENRELIGVRGLGGGINRFFRREFRANFGYATDGMAVSPDGNLFIVACGSQYEGNMDLYYSTNTNGTWSFLKRLDVSTKGNERSVYIASDNQTIYFSSDGYGGFGGLDILKTTFKNGQTGPVSNIGKPFNTRKNDMGFVISGKGESAFFIRDLDIYYADLKNIDDKIKPSASSLVYGKVLLNGKPAKEEIIVTSNGNIIGKGTTDENGKYSISISTSIERAKVFINASVDDVFTPKEIVSKGQRYEEFEVDFQSENIKTEPKLKQVNLIEDKEDIIRGNELIIYFDFNLAKIEAKEITKLNSLVKMIHSSSIVMIVGHTDQVGTIEYNEHLSIKRAEAVKDWLIQNTQVKSTQIDLKFKGESELLNNGTNTNERALNRRVTVKVVSH